MGRQREVRDGLWLGTLNVSAGSVAARFKASSRLQLGPGHVEAQVTSALPKMKLKAKSKGDLESATLSAAFHAKKLNKTMYLYYGNSYGFAVWRVSYTPSDYLSPINNTGTVVYSVTPELIVSRHEVIR